MSNTQIELYQSLLKGRNIKLIEEIKDGSMSTSFKAFHEGLKREVFVKFISIPPEEETSIEIEIQALIKLRNIKNIVNVIDAFYDELTNSQLVIVMEFIKGSSLEKICGLNSISTRKALEIVANVLYGIGEIHNLNLVHRDIKLENIILEQGNPIVVDLGSVKSNNNKVKVDDPIPYLYRSPEVLLNSLYSKKSDLYQIGLILFQLINGRLPNDIEFYAKMAKKPYDESNVDNYAISQLTKLVTKNKLTEIIIVEPVYCQRLKRLVDNALKLHYTSAASFYNDICKVKSNIPEWKKENDTTYICNDWKRYSFKVVIDLGGFRIYKVGMIRNKELGYVKSGLELNAFIQNV